MSTFYKEEKFKETPIGKIPEDWEVVRLGDKKVSILIKSGSTPLKKVKDYWNGNIPFVTQADMTKVERYLYETSEKITELGLKSSNLLLVPENSILLSMYGTIGKVVMNKTPVAVSQNIAAIIPNKEYIDEKFLYYAIQKCSSQFKRRAKIITLRHLDIKIVKNALLTVPSLTEQKAIAHILSAVDEAIQKTDEIIGKTERLKKGLMQELLTKGIGHKEFKDTEIGRIPKEWEVIRLGEVVEVYDSKRIPLSETERSKRKGPYPYCGANGIIDYIDDYIFDGEFVLLAEDGGNYGKFENTAYIMEGKFWVNNHAHILQAIKEKAINPFILFILNFLDLNPYIVGSTRKKLNQEQMKKIKIPLPPLPEQRRIAEILSTVDQKLKIERNEKAKLERIKQGLMGLLLTGKIRVKVN